jgi:hypothetical protein
MPANGRWGLHSTGDGTTWAAVGKRYVARVLAPTLLGPVSAPLRSRMASASMARAPALTVSSTPPARKADSKWRASSSRDAHARESAHQAARRYPDPGTGYRGAAGQPERRGQRPTRYHRANLGDGQHLIWRDRRCRPCATGEVSLSY